MWPASANSASEPDSSPPAISIAMNPPVRTSAASARFSLLRSSIGSVTVGGLVARDHAAHQVLAVRHAGQDHAGDVQQDQNQGQVGEELVDLFHGAFRALAAFAADALPAGAV